MKTGLLKLPNH